MNGSQVPERRQDIAGRLANSGEEQSLHPALLAAPALPEVGASGHKGDMLAAAAQWPKHSETASHPPGPATMSVATFDPALRSPGRTPYSDCIGLYEPHGKRARQSSASLAPTGGSKGYIEALPCTSCGPPSAVHLSEPHNLTIPQPPDGPAGQPASGELRSSRPRHAAADDCTAFATLLELTAKQHSNAATTALSARSSGPSNSSLPCLDGGGNASRACGLQPGLHPGVVSPVAPSLQALEASRARGLQPGLHPGVNSPVVPSLQLPGAIVSQPLPSADALGIPSQGTQLSPGPVSITGAPDDSPRRDSVGGVLEDAAARYTGVRRNKGGRYSARIKLGGSNSYIGTYKTAEEAARAFDAVAIQHGRPVETLNFPAAHGGPTVGQAYRKRKLHKLYQDPTNHINVLLQKLADVDRSNPGIVRLTMTTLGVPESRFLANNKYSGVRQQACHWEARIRFKDKLYSMGFYSTVEAAALAWDISAASLRRCGRLNFPEVSFADLEQQLDALKCVISQSAPQVDVPVGSGSTMAVTGLEGGSPRQHLAGIRGSNPDAAVAAAGAIDPLATERFWCPLPVLPEPCKGTVPQGCGPALTAQDAHEKGTEATGGPTAGEPASQPSVAAHVRACPGAAVPAQPVGVAAAPPTCMQSHPVALVAPTSAAERTLTGAVATSHGTVRACDCAEQASAVRTDDSTPSGPPVVCSREAARDPVGSSGAANAPPGVVAPDTGSRHGPLDLCGVVARCPVMHSGLPSSGGTEGGSQSAASRWLEAWTSGSQATPMWDHAQSDPALRAAELVRQNGHGGLQGARPHPSQSPSHSVLSASAAPAATAHGASARGAEGRAMNGREVTGVDTGARAVWPGSMYPTGTLGIAEGESKRNVLASRAIPDPAMHAPWARALGVQVEACTGSRLPARMGGPWDGPIEAPLQRSAGGGAVEAAGVLAAKSPSDAALPLFAPPSRGPDTR